MRRSAQFRAVAREGLREKWGMSVLVTFVASLLGGLGGGGGSGAGSSALDTAADVANNSGDFLSEAQDFFGNPLVASVLAGVLGVILLFGLAQFILGAAVELGHDRYYIGLIGGETPGFGALFTRFSIFGKALGLRLFIGLFILLWALGTILPWALLIIVDVGPFDGLLYIIGLLALILPIWASLRYALATYLMAQYPEKGIRECVNESKALMQGHKERLFWLELSFIGWVILCVLTFGIGILWLEPYRAAARAAFYLERTGQLPEGEGGGEPRLRV